MQSQEIVAEAATRMLNRGWKRLTTNRKEGVYLERSRRNQSLFQHTMVETDALISILPI